MSNFIFYRLEFSAILRENFSVSIFVQTTGYGIYSVSRKPIRLPEIQYPMLTKQFVTALNVLIDNGG